MRRRIDRGGHDSLQVARWKTPAAPTSSTASREQRQTRTKPLIETLALGSRNDRVSGRSPVAEAIRYALWPGLVRFVDDGRVEIDNNTVERSIRPIALNRKYALVAGADEGGDDAFLMRLRFCRSANHRHHLSRQLSQLLALFDKGGALFLSKLYLYQARFGERAG